MGVMIYLFASAMMTSWNGNIFRVTGHLCGKFTPVNSPHKGQWRGALMFSLICVWINGWVNKREAGDVRRHRAQYDVIVMHGSVQSRPHTTKQPPQNLTPYPVQSGTTYIFACVKGSLRTSSWRGGWVHIPGIICRLSDPSQLWRTSADEFLISFPERYKDDLS